MKKITFLLMGIGIAFSGFSQAPIYTEDFESGATGWIVNNGASGSWALGTPAASVMNSASSGVNAFATNLTGNYNNNENSNVTSPPINIATATAAAELSMRVWWDSENSWDGANVFASYDGGSTWSIIGADGDPNNWYNDNTINGAPGGAQDGWSGNFSNASGGWVTAIHSLDPALLVSSPTLMLRINFGSDGSVSGYNGFAFDDVQILDLLPLDIGISAIDSPSVPTCNLSNEVWATISNTGITTVTTATVQWEVNGTAQTAFSYTGSLTAGSDTSLMIGTSAITIVDGTDIKVWTELPNGSLESVFGNSNDTTALTVATGLNGIYTIGGTTPDYATIDDARIALEAFGVCGGPTTFNLRAGTYNEQVTFAEILGASAINTITFTSEDAHKDSVLWTNSTASSASRGTINLNGADYFNFTHLTIENTHFSYPTAVTLLNGSDWNTFAWNCLLGDTTPTSTSINQCVIYSNNGEDNNNTFDNNTIWGGSYGAYMRGTGTTALENNTTFTNNWFKNQYRYGAYFYYQDNITVSNNKVTTNSPYTGSSYGFYLYYCDNASVITGNEIVKAGTGTKYGIYYGNGDGSAINNGLIANNMISLGDSVSSSTIYGIYVTNSGYTNIVNNSILINTTSTFGRSLYVAGGGANTATNNNLVNYGAGYGYYVSSNFSLTTTDYNNIYCPNGLFAYANGGARADIAALQAQGVDVNSLSVNPMFYSNSDLHTCADSLDGMGMINAFVTNDIDGNPRNTNSPDIGADEFIGMANYSIGPDIAICAGDSVELFAGGTSSDIVSWITGETTNTIWVSTAGNYSVTLNGVCGSDGDDLNVTVETLTPSFTQTSSFLTAIFTNTSIGIIGTTTYLWDFGDGTTSTDENPIHIYSTQGIKSVTLTVTSDCGTQTTTTDITLGIVGVDEIVMGGKFNMYPNPATNNLNIGIQLSDNGDATLRITDITGRIVSTKDFGTIATGETVLPIDISDLNAGTYFIVLTVDNQVFTQKLSVFK